MPRNRNRIIQVILSCVWPNNRLMALVNLKSCDYNPKDWNLHITDLKIMISYYQSLASLDYAKAKELGINKTPLVLEVVNWKDEKTIGSRKHFQLPFIVKVEDWQCLDWFNKMIKNTPTIFKTEEPTNATK